jgi:hypothetical protein
LKIELQKEECKSNIKQSILTKAKAKANYTPLNVSLTEGKTSQPFPPEPAYYYNSIYKHTYYKERNKTPLILPRGEIIIRSNSSWRYFQPYPNQSSLNINFYTKASSNNPPISHFYTKSPPIT